MKIEEETKIERVEKNVVGGHYSLNLFDFQCDNTGQWVLCMMFYYPIDTLLTSHKIENTRNLFSILNNYFQYFE